jgi:methylmalonyl-CoA mutase
LAAGHLTHLPLLKAALKAAGRDDILVVVGGVIPPEDVAALQAMGATAVFPPGTVIPDAALALIERLNASLGFAQPPASTPP